jgi:cyclopropane-fatty-acyl-phospholipid synthase
MSTRGEHLLHADRRFATGGGLVARLTAPAFAKVLDEIDRRLAKGGIDATLPDGTRRRLGFNAKGPTAAVRLSSWRALVRLATSGSVGWYKAWALGEWSSPDPVKVFELFSANAVPLGNVGRAKGPFRWVNRIAHRLRDNAPGKARANIAAHYDLGNDFYSAWLDATMTYSSARFATPKDTLEQGQLRKVHLLLDRKPQHRPLRRQRRLHPDLHLSRRAAARRTAIRSACSCAGPELGRARRLRPRLCGHAEALARAL